LETRIKSEDEKKTKASQEYWTQYRTERAKHAAAGASNAPPKPTSTEDHPMPHSSDPKPVWFACRDEARGWVIDAHPDERDECVQILRKNGVLLPGEFASPDEAFAAV
jgi:hypothetical protein